MSLVWRCHPPAILPPAKTGAVGQDVDATRRALPCAGHHTREACGHTFIGANLYGTLDFFHPRGLLASPVPSLFVITAERRILPPSASSLYACIITSPSSHLFFSLSPTIISVFSSPPPLSFALRACAYTYSTRAVDDALLYMRMRAGARRSGSQGTTIQEPELPLAPTGHLFVWMLYSGYLSGDTPAFPAW